MTPRSTALDLEPDDTGALITLQSIRSIFDERRQKPRLQPALSATKPGRRRRPRPMSAQAGVKDEAKRSPAGRARAGPSHRAGRTRCRAPGRARAADRSDRSRPRSPVSRPRRQGRGEGGGPARAQRRAALRRAPSAAMAPIEVTPPPRRCFSATPIAERWRQSSRCRSVRSQTWPTASASQQRHDDETSQGREQPVSAACEGGRGQGSRATPARRRGRGTQGSREGRGAPGE